MAQAHRGLGDEQLAAADAATADSIYDQLGVEPAGSAARDARSASRKRDSRSLTRIARGATNRLVAQQMFISEKTVE